MKYLITESQLDKVIFRYLDNQDFIQIVKGNRIYFVNSEGDEYAQIRYDKEDGWCFIDYDLITEISSSFSLQRSDSQEVIGRWVDNTPQMKVTNIISPELSLNLPVDNTPQMKVTNTGEVEMWARRALRIPN